MSLRVALIKSMFRSTLELSREGSLRDRAAFLRERIRAIDVLDRLGRVASSTIDVSIGVDEHEDRIEVGVYGIGRLDLTFDGADDLRRGMVLAMEAIRLRQLARTQGLPCAICHHHHPAGAAHVEAGP